MVPRPVPNFLQGTILFATACALLAGCNKAGSPLVEVSGQVTVDGSPLTEGTVSFISSSGKIASARLDANGGFRLTSQYGAGVPVGEYRVIILPPPQMDSRDRQRMLGQGKLPAATSPIPDRYQRPDRSGLNAVVENGPLRLNFDLTTP